MDAILKRDFSFLSCPKINGYTEPLKSTVVFQTVEHPRYFRKAEKKPTSPTELHIMVQGDIIHPQSLLSGQVPFCVNNKQTGNGYAGTVVLRAGYSLDTFICAG